MLELKPWMLTLAAGLCLAAPTLAEEIRFRPGADSATVQGAVIRGERDTYTIGAGEGQKIWIRLTSLESNAVFDLYSPGEEPLGESEATQLEGRLPESGTYRIVVSPSRGNAEYTLKVTIR
ncbi:MAG: hypothetical protein AMXMBFR33_72620 [Candidatus Xenobia bacterium]